MATQINEVFDDDDEKLQNNLIHQESITLWNDYKQLKHRLQQHNAKYEQLTEKILNLNLTKAKNLCITSYHPTHSTLIRNVQRMGFPVNVKEHLILIKKLLLINIKSIQIMQRFYKEKIELQQLLDNTRQLVNNQKEILKKIKYENESYPRSFGDPPKLDIFKDDNNVSLITTKSSHETDCVQSNAIEIREDGLFIPTKSLIQTIKSYNELNDTNVYIQVNEDYKEILKKFLIKIIEDKYMNSKLLFEKKYFFGEPPLIINKSINNEINDSIAITKEKKFNSNDLKNFTIFPLSIECKNWIDTDIQNNNYFQVDNFNHHNHGTSIFEDNIYKHIFPLSIQWNANQSYLPEIHLKDISDTENKMNNSQKNTEKIISESCEDTSVTQQKIFLNLMINNDLKNIHKIKTMQNKKLVDIYSESKNNNGNFTDLTNKLENKSKLNQYKVNNNINFTQPLNDSLHNINVKSNRSNVFILKSNKQIIQTPRKKKYFNDHLKSTTVAKDNSQYYFKESLKSLENIIKCCNSTSKTDTNITANVYANNKINVENASIKSENKQNFSHTSRKDNYVYTKIPDMSKDYQIILQNAKHKGVTYNFVTSHNSAIQSILIGTPNKSLSSKIRRSIF